VLENILKLGVMPTIHNDNNCYQALIFYFQFFFNILIAFSALLKELCPGWLYLVACDSTDYTYNRSTTSTAGSSPPTKKGFATIRGILVQIKTIQPLSCWLGHGKFIFMIYALSCNPEETLRQRLFFDLTWNMKTKNKKKLFPQQIKGKMQ